jgi:hypothetical protein
MTETHRSGCPVNLPLEVFGDKWSLLTSLAVSLMPIRTTRAAIYAPVRQHRCPT